MRYVRLVLVDPVLAEGVILATSIAHIGRGII
jgi:hypothetical protein